MRNSNLIYSLHFKDGTGFIIESVTPLFESWTLCFSGHNNFDAWPGTLFLDKATGRFGDSYPIHTGNPTFADCIQYIIVGTQYCNVKLPFISLTDDEYHFGQEYASYSDNIKAILYHFLNIHFF